MFGISSLALLRLLKLQQNIISHAAEMMLLELLADKQQPVCCEPAIADFGMLLYTPPYQ